MTWHGFPNIGPVTVLVYPSFFPNCTSDFQYFALNGWNLISVQLFAPTSFLLACDFCPHWKVNDWERKVDPSATLNNLGSCRSLVSPRLKMQAMMQKVLEKWGQWFHSSLSIELGIFYRWAIELTITSTKTLQLKPQRNNWNRISFVKLNHPTVQILSLPLKLRAASKCPRSLGALIWFNKPAPRDMGVPEWQ